MSHDMRRDEHQQIGHSDSEHERCPLCHANDRGEWMFDALLLVRQWMDGMPTERAHVRKVVDDAIRRADWRKPDQK
jgi:hypothetical protein